MKKLFKIITTCIACICVIMTGGLLAGCKKDDGSAKLATIRDMYGFASATSSILAVGYVAEPQAFTINPIGISYENIVNTVDGHIEVFESIVGGKKPVSTKKVESDNVLYATKLVVETSDITGKAETFSIYYNEYATTDDHHTNAIIDPDDYELESVLEGIVIYVNGETTYELALSGEKEVEIDEMEISFRVAYEDKTICFTQETEANEQEFTYEVYQGGTLIEEFSFEMEVERNKVEVEFSIEYASDVYYFEVEQITQNGKKVLKISGTADNGAKYKIIVIVEEDGGVVTNTYKFPDGTSIKKVR